MAALLATPLWLIAQPAYACSCFSGDVSWYADHANIIVIGTPVRSKPDIQVRVDRYLKGNGSNVIVMPFNPSSCGFLYEESIGRRYLLYAKRASDGSLRADLCNGSTPLDGEERIRGLDQLSQVLAYLGEPSQRPNTAPIGVATDGRPVWALPFAVAGGSAALLSLAFILWRGTRRA